MFIEDRCDFCGVCLEKCPEVDFSSEGASRDFELLFNGGDAEIVKRCSSCFACNLYCESGANPYDLVLKRWNERYRVKGAPPIFSMLCPPITPNLWSSFHAVAPARTRMMLNEWLEQEPQEEVLFIGSYNYLVPEVFYGSTLLAGLPVMSLPQHWECGAYLYQMGYLDEVRRVGAMVKEDLDSWGVRRVVNSMDAVQHLFTEIQPREMGVEFSQDFRGLYDLVLERFASGELSIEKTLDLTVTPHDNCYSKASGTDDIERSRKLLELTGCRILEMEHFRENALCCGFGLGASWTSNRKIPFDILGGSIRRVREAEKTGADVLVTYCGGCMWLLLVARELCGSRIRVAHIVELLREAMGERFEFDPTERAWDIASVITYQILRQLPRGRFFLDRIRCEAGEDVWSELPSATLRGIHSLLSTRAGRAAYRAGFRGIQSLAG